MRSWIGICVMSWPSNSIRPESGRWIPVIMLKNVVLPAPFGPIRLCSRNGCTSRFTSPATTRDPKRFCRPVTVSTGLPACKCAPPPRNGAITAGRGGMPRRVKVQSSRPINRKNRPWMPSGEASANTITIGAKISHQLSVIAESRSSSRMKAMAPQSGPMKWCTPPSTVISRLSPACCQLRLSA